MQLFLTVLNYFFIKQDVNKYSKNVYHFTGLNHLGVGQIGPVGRTAPYWCIDSSCKEKKVFNSIELFFLKKVSGLPVNLIFKFDFCIHFYMKVQFREVVEGAFLHVYGCFFDIWCIMQL